MAKVPVGSSRLGRIAPLSGLVFAVLFLAGNAITDNTRYLPPAEEVWEFITANSFQVRMGAHLMGVSAFFLLVFTGAVWSSLRAEEGNEQLFPAVSVGGGFVAAGLILANFAVLKSAAQRSWSDGGLSPVAATTLHDLGDVLAGGALPIALAALIGGFIAVSFRTGRLPKWLNWVSLLLVLGMLQPYNWVVFPGAFPWIAIVSVLMYRQRRPG